MAEGAFFCCMMPPSTDWLSVAGILNAGSWLGDAAEACGESVKSMCELVVMDDGPTPLNTLEAVGREEVVLEREYGGG